MSFLRRRAPESTRAGSAAAGAGAFTLYTTSWCGFCARLKLDLNRAGIGYDEIDIEADRDAAATVEQINNGNQTVPTLVFSDGATMTNPGIDEVVDKLATLGKLAG